MWPMQAFSDEFDDHIVLSFFGYTKYGYNYFHIFLIDIFR